MKGLCPECNGMHRSNEPCDPFDIPAFLDRRGEPVVRPPIKARRKWIMPTPERVRRLKRQREKLAAAAKRAEKRDMAAIEKQFEAAEKAAELLRKVK